MSSERPELLTRMLGGEFLKSVYLCRQYQLLIDEKIMTEEELKKYNEIAFESIFIPEGDLTA